MSDNIVDVDFTEVSENKNVRFLYLAIAEKQDGEIVYGTLHDTWQQAEKSAHDMCREINTHMKDWRVRPSVMDLEYVSEQTPIKEP